jgi:hypothetical protein
MTRSHARTNRVRIAIAMLVVFALLFQSAFVIACDAHDLGHDFSQSDHDGKAHEGISGSPDIVSGKLPSSDRDEGTWHEIFTTGHGIAQVLETTAALSIETLALPGARPATAVHDRIPPAPLNMPLRPPIGS